MRKTSGAERGKLLIQSDGVQTVMVREGENPVIAINDSGRHGEPSVWMGPLAMAVNFLNCGVYMVKIWSEEAHWFAEKNPAHLDGFVAKIGKMAKTISPKVECFAFPLERGVIIFSNKERS
ncbi:MAG: hypothetical protein KBC81_00280 [Candidatus Pacebacteria bacterium]|nr:hypothetical protein [Candidatus Paceibacterota bacterium]